MPESLLALALLACPLVMGLMMWFMMRGHKAGTANAKAMPRNAEVVALQAEVDQLKAATRERARTGGELRALP